MVMMKNVPYTCGWIVPYFGDSEQDYMAALMENEENLMTMELNKMRAEELEKE